MHSARASMHTHRLHRPTRAQELITSLSLVCLGASHLIVHNDMRLQRVLKHQQFQSEL
jgi:hypothetical protein